MNHPVRKVVICLGASLTLSTTALMAQQLSVKIVDRRTGDSDYSYVVPGSVLAQSDATANCFGVANSVGCSGTSTTTGTITPPRAISYSVKGATFTLQLPDGRLAIVNCDSKYALKGDYINRRSCRMPLVDEIQAEFKGDNAKLRWPVSLDGKKTESETYKILAIMGGRR